MKFEHSMNSQSFFLNVNGIVRAEFPNGSIKYSFIIWTKFSTNNAHNIHDYEGTKKASADVEVVLG